MQRWTQAGDARRALRYQYDALSVYSTRGMYEDALFYEVLAQIAAYS